MDENTESKREQAVKKRRVPKRIVIIAIAAVALVVLIVGGLLLYAALAPQNITGDWELIVNPELSRATPDEASIAPGVYYTFSEPDNNGEGTYKTYFDGGVEEGTYTLIEKGDRRFINMGTEDLPYTLSGSALFGTKRLTVTYPEQTDESTGETTPAQDYVFAGAKAPDYEHEVYDSYRTDEQLLGEWITTERTLSYYVYELSYTQTVRFADNGIMTIRYESADLLLDRVMYYAYTAKNGTLTFSPVTDKETTYTVGYQMGTDAALHFTDDTASSIFSDAFFGDVPYYDEGYLPADPDT